MVYVIMGVSGCGKSTIAKMLATELRVRCFDADDFHSKENIEKMSNSKALNCGDRLPWLVDLAQRTRYWNSLGGATLACSALKESYRKVLELAGNVKFIYLKGSRETLTSRIQARDSFMPLTLLQSQLETLEEPENAIIVDITLSPDEIINVIFNHLDQEEEYALYS
jgi:carbohydrate kinase (thermoresistant glucokinase family)